VHTKNNTILSVVAKLHFYGNSDVPHIWGSPYADDLYDTKSYTETSYLL